MKLLYQMFDEVFPLTGQHVDDRKLHHGVTSWLLAHAGACHVDQYLPSLIHISEPTRQDRPSRMPSSA